MSYCEPATLHGKHKARQRAIPFTGDPTSPNGRQPACHLVRGQSPPPAIPSCAAPIDSRAGQAQLSLRPWQSPFPTLPSPPLSLMPDFSPHPCCLSGLSNTLPSSQLVLKVKIRVGSRRRQLCANQRDRHAAHARSCNMTCHANSFSASLFLEWPVSLCLLTPTEMHDRGSTSSCRGGTSLPQTPLMDLAVDSERGALRPLRRLPLLPTPQNKQTDKQGQIQIEIKNT